MDDEHTMFFGMTANRVPRASRDSAPSGRAFSGYEQQANSSDWYGRFRLVSDASNDFRIDRPWQRSGAGNGGTTQFM